MKSFYKETSHGTFHFEMPDNNPEGLPIVIFLHGGSTRSQHTKFWDPILEIIRKHCYPVLTDRFGHGKSTGDGGLQANLKVLGEIIEELLEDKEKSKVYLVGRSAGAVYCMRLYESNPDRIAGMGLIAPASLGSFAKKLVAFGKPLTLLWDVNDPIVSFSNYHYITDLGIKAPLFTIGDHQNAIRSEAGDSKPSHTPELMAPQLFDAFLENLLR